MVQLLIGKRYKLRNGRVNRIVDLTKISEYEVEVRFEKEFKPSLGYDSSTWWIYTPEGLFISDIDKDPADLVEMLPDPPDNP